MQNAPCQMPSEYTVTFMYSNKIATQSMQNHVLYISHDCGIYILFNIVLLHIGRKHLEEIQSNCIQIVKLIDKFCGNIILQVTCF